MHQFTEENLIWQHSIILFLLEVLKFSLFNRCAGAGHLRDDILYYCKEFEKFTDGDDEERAHLMDMGVKALRYSSHYSEPFLFSSCIFTFLIQPLIVTWRMGVCYL